MMGIARLSSRPSQRVPDVQVAQPVTQVSTGEESLGHGDPVRAEEPVVGLHEAALPDRGQHLPFGEIPPQPGGAQEVPSCGDRSRGNEDHLGAVGVEPSDLVDEGGHHIAVQVAVHPCEEGGAGLHHNAAIAPAVPVSDSGVCGRLRLSKGRHEKHPEVEGVRRYYTSVGYQEGLVSSASLLVMRV